MRLEYFQMIDRFVELDLGERTVRARSARCPTQSTIFEGHFPGYPLMPGVLLIECMAQTTGWLVSALTGFTGMPALAGQGRQDPRFVFPGDELEFEGKWCTKAPATPSAKPKDACKGERSATPSSPTASCPFRAGAPRRHCGIGPSASICRSRSFAKLTARREVWITGVGLLTCLGEGLEARWSHLERGDPPPYDDKSFAPYIVHPLAPMTFDKQIPKKSDQRQMEPWQRVGVYAAGLALSDAGHRRQARSPRPHRHDRRRRRRRARHRGRQRDPDRHAQGRRTRALPQRAADERPAAHAVPGAAVRTCLPATSRSCTASSAPRAPSWARNEPASTPCASRRRASPPVRATSPWSAAPTTAPRWDVLLIFELSGSTLQGQICAGLGSRPAGRHRAWLPWAPFWSSKAASMRRRAAPRRAHLAASVPTAIAASRATSKRRCARHGRRSPLRSTAPHAASFPALPGSSRRLGGAERAQGVRASRPQHRDLYRTWRRDPVRGEYRHRRRRARARQAVSPRPEVGDGGASPPTLSAGRRHQRRQLARRRARAGRTRPNEGGGAWHAHDTR